MIVAQSEAPSLDDQPLGPVSAPVDLAANDAVEAMARPASLPTFIWPSPIGAFRPPPIAMDRRIPELPSVEQIARAKLASFGPRQMRLAARRSLPPLFTSVPPKIAPAYLLDDIVREALAVDAPVPPRRPDGMRRLAHARFTPQMAFQSAAVAPAPAVDNRNFFEMLFDAKPSSPASPSNGSTGYGALAYAPADGGLFSRNSGQAAISASTRASGQTAVYDISARMVYLPDGTRLEAHSGLGSLLDDPHYAHIRMRGVTPPHLYALTPREALFHGVEALRLTPIGGSGAIHGRAGLLAHTYMLGPNGDSNGCVSFRDYGAFLRAYKSGQIRYLSVVSSR